MSNFRKFVALPGAVFLLFCFFLSSAVFAGTGDAKSWSKNQLQGLYVGFLEDNGFRPTIDSDGHVVFPYEGKTFVILVSEDDLEFFQIIMPNIWRIESETERLQVFQAMDYSNAVSKVSQVFSIGDYVWVGIELFFNDPVDFQGVFFRALAAIQNGVDNFLGKMRE
ncbi:MAG TPA: hypothetical protein P5560_12920 [Thermotogota bacterium]|nr:hypothetical protein [Thermotogota bacterium]HRW93847.1 hypothetical protein [Thermotogota bacterium]